VLQSIDLTVMDRAANSTVRAEELGHDEHPCPTIS
jgi:hypothetical protein